MVGRLFDGTLPAHSTQAVSVSPGRTGFSQRFGAFSGGHVTGDNL